MYIFVAQCVKKLIELELELEGDIFLTIQRSTTIASKIYNFFAMPKADFLTALSDYSDVHDLRYVRDIMVSIVKRKTKRAIGPLVERKSGTNMKDNLLKDIYNLYSFGEGSVQSLPNQKSMLRCDSRYSDQCVQTDSSVNLVCNSDLEILKDELLANFDELKNEVLKSNKSCSATSQQTNSSFTSAVNQLVEANNHLMPVQPNLQEYPLYITPVRNYPASPHFHQLHPLYPPQLFPRQQSNQGPMNIMEPQMLSRY